MTTLPSAEPVVADLRPTAAGSVCAECGKPCVFSTDPRHGYDHVKPATHRVRATMSRAQWDRWVER